MKRRSLRKRGLPTEDRQEDEVKKKKASDDEETSVEAGSQNKARQEKKKTEKDSPAKKKSSCCSESNAGETGRSDESSSAMVVDEKLVKTPQPAVKRNGRKGNSKKNSAKGKEVTGPASFPDSPPEPEEISDVRKGKWSFSRARG